MGVTVMCELTQIETTRFETNLFSEWIEFQDLNAWRLFSIDLGHQATLTDVIHFVKLAEMLLLL